MRRFLIGNAFLLASMLCAATSQILIKALLEEPRPSGLGRASLRWVLEPARFARGSAAATLIVLGFLAWLFALARLDLSYAYPVACSSVLLVTLFSTLFLGEPVTLRIWIGTVLIVIGMTLLVPGH